MFDNQCPQTAWQSGSGFAYVHSRGALVTGLVVLCGSVKGTVQLFESTSASAATMRAFVRAQVNTTGNPTIPVAFNPPVTFKKKIKLKIKGGGTGAAGVLFGRIVTQVNFIKSTYRASTS